jgi:C-terminal of Roc, COR, domain/Ras of Complex, Roc, domain of DAPkinase/Leucine rich repeat
VGDEGLREALRRIERSGGESLDFSELQLTDDDLAGLVRPLAGLGTLASLDLWGNQLTTLPEDFATLDHLAALDLGGNRLHSFPRSLVDLPVLSTVTLSGNAIEALPDVVGNLRALTALGLRGNRLGSLPESIGGLSRLATLTLGKNRLSRLPDSLGSLAALTSLNLSGNRLTSLPESLGNLGNLQDLDLRGNRLEELPVSVGSLRRLSTLDAWGNCLDTLPESFGSLRNLTTAALGSNVLTSLPESLGQLRRLQSLNLRSNRLQALPRSLGGLPDLREIDVSRNPLPQEVVAAASDGTQELLRFLRLVSSEGQLLCEAKLLLVGEGAVGKTTLLAALRGEPWARTRDTTHGIEIKPVTLVHQDQTITLNGWDFGGQRTYRPTHQLFFTRPAVYLVVWKPREGPELGMVQEWIRLIRHRAGAAARVHVVATHGGPTQRFAHLDEASLRNRFGEMIAGFHHVDSKTGQGIPELRAAIGATADRLPHLSRWYPGSWLRLRAMLSEGGSPYLTYDRYEAFAVAEGLQPSSARSLAISSHALGHWVHYADDPGLRDLVVLRPDWLSRAIGFVLDDPETVLAGGLVTHRELARIWDSPERDPAHRYARPLQQLFLRLMERFELSYRVPDSRSKEPTSLVAQLVPAAQPDLTAAWTDFRSEADELVQVCRILERGTSRDIIPEALVFRLLVLFHRYSLGRDDVRRSVHWQQGFLIQDRYGARALVRIENGRLTVRVRGAYPQRFLDHLAEEIQDYVEEFWPGLSARFAVPCGPACGLGAPGTGLFDVQKLIAQRDKGRSHFLCTVPECDREADIAQLLQGIGVSGSTDTERLVAVVQETVRAGFDAGWRRLDAGQDVGIQRIIGRLEDLDDRAKVHFARVEANLTALQRGLDDEAADGPRLFTLEPLAGSIRHPGATSIRMRLALWCEHSRLPLSVLRGNRKAGVYDLSMPREWWVKAAPLIRTTSVILKALLPVSLSVAELELSDRQWSAVQKQLGVGRDTVAPLVDRGQGVSADADGRGLPPQHDDGDGDLPVYAEGGLLRSLHETLRRKDPTFADLRRVRNSHGRYLWVDERYQAVYQPPLPEIPD